MLVLPPAVYYGFIESDTLRRLGLYMEAAIGIAWRLAKLGVDPECVGAGVVAIGHLSIASWTWMYHSPLGFPLMAAPLRGPHPPVAAYFGGRRRFYKQRSRAGRAYRFRFRDAMSHMQIRFFSAA